MTEIPKLATYNHVDRVIRQRWNRIKHWIKRDGKPANDTNHVATETCVLANALTQEADQNEPAIQITRVRS